MHYEEEDMEEMQIVEVQDKTQALIETLLDIWQRGTATSGVYTEAESTTFATSGIVRTADGRDINFNMEVSMSRAFTASINSLEVESYIKTDPLMINLDTDIGSVSDQKFFFDLDADGKEEEISFAGKESGFLALDRNGDGKINDGSELFGTKSGDGFKDLAAYDEDGNVDTQYSLKDDENKLNGKIKKTGIYLRESSGEVGTMNHVELVV